MPARTLRPRRAKSAPQHGRASKQSSTERPESQSGRVSAANFANQLSSKTTKKKLSTRQTRQPTSIIGVREATWGREYLVQLAPARRRRKTRRKHDAGTGDDGAEQAWLSELDLDESTKELTLEFDRREAAALFHLQSQAEHADRFSFLTGSTVASLPPEVPIARSPGLAKLEPPVAKMAQRSVRRKARRASPAEATNFLKLVALATSGT